MNNLLERAGKTCNSIAQVNKVSTTETPDNQHIKAQSCTATGRAGTKLCIINATSKEETKQTKHKSFLYLLTSDEQSIGKT